MAEKEEVFSTPESTAIPFGLVDSEQRSLSGPRTTRATDAKGAASSTICVSGIPTGVAVSEWTARCQHTWCRLTLHCI